MLPDEGQDGFTLLETLIAFMILSAALAISAQTISVAARSVSLSKERNEVLRLADILRAETHSTGPQKGKEASGERDLLEWKIRYLPVNPSGSNEQNAGFSIVTISFRSGREHKFIYFETSSR